MLIAFLAMTFLGYGQTKKADQKFGIKWHGFVKADYMLDTHQTVTAREGHFLLFPTSDATPGSDQANFNILAIQTRLKGAFTGPDFLVGKLLVL